jgi:hypothetical protein
MHHRESGHYCTAVTGRAAPPDIVKWLQDYARGYADRQAERRP